MEEQKTISRREVIKAGGLLALGLAYHKPIIETVRAKPAFAAYGSREIGFSPGFWMQVDQDNDGSDKVRDAWAATGYNPDDNYNQVFGVTRQPESDTLLDALVPPPEDDDNLGMHSVAALLNAAYFGDDYEYTEDEVIQMVQDAYNAFLSGVSNAYKELKNLFEATYHIFVAP